MNWIMDNWWSIMRTLASENVENFGSLAIGYIAFCVTLTSASPIPAALMFLKSKRAWVYAFIAVIWLAASVWILTTYQVHEIWNAYQLWFKTPLGAPLG